MQFKKIEKLELKNFILRLNRNLSFIKTTLDQYKLYFLCNFISIFIYYN